MKSTWVRNIFLSVWSLLMTALTVVLGAVSLKALRTHAGRITYWTMSLGVSASLMGAGYWLDVKMGSGQLLLLAMIYLSLVFLIGLFSEFEEMDISLLAAGFFAMVVTALSAAGGFAIWASRVGPSWPTALSEVINANFLKPLVDMKMETAISAWDIMGQLPSLILMVWMGAIYLAVILEARIWGRNEPTVGAKFRGELAEVRMPDPVIWLFILGLLGTFGGIGPKWVEVASINFLNLALMLFFFQGVAVISRFFNSVRMSAFWQMIFMVFIVVNLFVFVSLLGMIDHWVDFRSRLEKRAQQFNEEA